MATKTYRSKQYLHLSTTVIVETPGEEKREVIVTFEGGSTHPVVYHGTFTTDDEYLQAALEKKAGFGIAYELAGIKGETGYPTAHANVPTPSSLGDTRKTPVVPPGDNGIQKINGISKFQSAKGYILENYPEITLDRVKTKERLLEVARQLHVEFPDLK